jgi:hypothetical protein
MPTLAPGWTAEDMAVLGTHHATVEAACDMEATMATLVPDPVYSFHPLNLGMRGHSAVRRYYEHLFSSFIPSTRGYTLLEQWVNEASVAQEYDIQVEADGRIETHRVIGILYAEGRLLGGERVYASERCARLMLGNELYDELEPLSR